MKFLNREGDAYRFALTTSEQRALLNIIQRYPVLNSSLKEIKLPGGADANEHQQLLEEALAEHRTEARQQILAILESEGRFHPEKKRLILTLSRPELDVLVAALNNIRVGSWIQLGSPDPARVPWSELFGPKAEHGFLMEMAGLFQSRFLGAFEENS